jgi:Flp pilus assembly pilin Flp
LMRRVWRTLRRLHSDEKGAQGLEMLLIIAAIVLPLLGLLLWFRDDIGRWVSSLWTQIKGDAQAPVQTP